jgi:hypothetical protein
MSAVIGRCPSEEELYTAPPHPLDYNRRVRAAGLPTPFERLVDHLCECPATTVGGAARRLSVSPRAALTCLERLVEGNVLHEVPVHGSQRLFLAPEIIRAMETDARPVPHVPAQGSLEKAATAR